MNNEERNEQVLAAVAEAKGTLNSVRPVFNDDVHSGLLDMAVAIIGSINWADQREDIHAAAVDWLWRATAATAALKTQPVGP